jgi:hypothetical protein
MDRSLPNFASALSAAATRRRRYSWGAKPKKTETFWFFLDTSLLYRVAGLPCCH